MAASTTPVGPSGLAPTEDSELQGYFTSIAPNYAHLTGHSTQKILSNILNSVPLGISNITTIHDNASGPGTATAAIMEWCAARAINPPSITATDINAGMIEKLEADAEEKGWKNVTAKIMDSHALQYEQDIFKFEFVNFSVFTFAKPLLALIEVHRTLKHTGITVVTCWKRFGIQEIMNEARKIVLGEEAGEPIKGPGEEFFREGYLAWLMEEAGWERGKIKTLTERVIVKDESDLAGMVDFMTGDFTKFARAGWSEDAAAKWLGAVQQALAAAKERDGGVVMEAWVVLARKWDALSA